MVENKLTYPNWNTGATYSLIANRNASKTEVYYVIKRNRKIGRNFPNEVLLTPNFSYALGLLKGEGSNSLGKSNYRRFTITIAADFNFRNDCKARLI